MRSSFHGRPHCVPGQLFINIFLLPFVNEPFFDATRNLSEVTPLEMMNIFN